MTNSIRKKLIVKKKQNIKMKAFANMSNNSKNLIVSEQK
jgi:hypothetical protein